MSFFGIGKNQRDGRYLLSIKDDSVGVQGAQAGVYLDTLDLLLLVETDIHYWVFWSVQGKGHCLGGDKQPDEHVLNDLRADIRGHFSDRKIVEATDLENAKSKLVNFGVTEKAAAGIIKYLGDY